ncbi:hypothetical protein [Methylobacterium aquaticum]|uniref:hypothetical protein n=1 Tax=Methylobacterium aquaticum TaxID=270351 RepID=UPI0019332427|nr:hypothetical protein [Methylobacterium aquaticum]
MQDRPALKAALRALVLLAGVGLVSSEEADLDEEREGAAHPGFGEPKVVPIGKARHLVQACLNNDSFYARLVARPMSLRPHLLLPPPGQAGPRFV